MLAPSSHVLGGGTVVAARTMVNDEGAGRHALVAELLPSGQLWA
jgi:hypothetical protein